MRFWPGRQGSPTPTSPRSRTATSPLPLRCWAPSRARWACACPSSSRVLKTAWTRSNWSRSARPCTSGRGHGKDRCYRDGRRFGKVSRSHPPPRLSLRPARRNRRRSWIGSSYNSAPPPGSTPCGPASGALTATCARRSWSSKRSSPLCRRKTWSGFWTLPGGWQGRS